VELAHESFGSVARRTQKTMEQVRYGYQVHDSGRSFFTLAKLLDSQKKNQSQREKAKQI